MRVIACVVFGLITATPAAAQQPPCQFSIIHPAPTPAVRGGDDFLSRLRFIRQPDSPVVVTAIDFTGGSLTVGASNYERRGGYSLEILNVSDQPIDKVRAMVHTRWISGMGGGGQGPKESDVLLPGQRMTLTVDGGSGRGTTPREDQLAVDVVIEWLRVNGCLYKPSQMVPLR